MAKEKKQEFVQHITPRDENFSQWYTDVVTRTDLMDYTPVRGCMALRPYGNRIWELIREQLDQRACFVPLDFQVPGAVRGVVFHGPVHGEGFAVIDGDSYGKRAVPDVQKAASMLQAY